MSDEKPVRMTTTAELDAGPPTEEVGKGASAELGIEEFGQLPGRPLRKRMGPLGYLLLAALVACAAFYGGARYGESQGSSGSTSGLAAGLAARFATSTNGTSSSGSSSASGTSLPRGASRSSSSSSPSPGSGSFLGSAVSGTIKLITGKDFYVTESGGTTVKVTTSAGTTIAISSTGSVSQLHPGDRVTVLGPNNNGTVSAKSISDLGNAGTSSSTASGFQPPAGLTFRRG